MLKNKIQKAYNWCYNQIAENGDYDSSYISEEAINNDISERAKELLMAGVENIPQDFEIINPNLSDKNYDKLLKLVIKFIDKEIR